MPNVQDPTFFLESLNAEQRQAVEAPAGPILVLAGPGSGKTRVLTHRVAYLVRLAGVEPWRIMAVTFTNKAARAMSARLHDLIGRQDLDRLTIGTFHAICARTLRREAEGLPFDSRFVIFDQTDQLRAVRHAIADLNLDDKTYRPQAVLGAISRAKNELQRPETFVAPTYWHEIAGRVFARYQEILRSCNALDFDDLLLETAFLLQSQPDVRSRYRERYRHILVDEFQDTNTAQYVLLQLLSGADDDQDPHNLFVVGDEDQSIYRWRGADYRNVARFQKDYPEARTILLEQNYRSTQTILDAAQEVISRNTHRTPKALWTTAGQGDPITLFEAYSETEEAAYVVRLIEEHWAAGEPLGQVAVMYRTNAQSRALEDAIVRRQIPYQLVGTTRFYERREVKDTLAYLRLVQNPLDELALERIINVPPRGIGPVAWRGLEAWAEALHLPKWSALELMRAEDGDLPEMPPLNRRALNALCAFHDTVAKLMDVRETLPLSQLLKHALDVSGYEAWLRDGSEEGEARWENVRELGGVAADYDVLQPRDALSAFLESIALVSDVDMMEDAADRVTLLTLHAAKGLEFPTVFITGIEEGILPHSRSLDDPEALAEERRLFYVGLTRSQRKIHLVHAFRRRLFGVEDAHERSRFLEDIPLSVLEGSGTSARTPRATRSAATRWSGQIGDTAPSAEQFRPGDRVHHHRFGKGVVVSSAPRDGDEEVTVAFVEAGVKKLMQSLARLEKA